MIVRLGHDSASWRSRFCICHGRRCRRAFGCDGDSPSSAETARVVLIGLFAVGNLSCALAPSYALLMTARIVTAFAHGAFFGIAAVVARDLVPRGRRTQAVSRIFAGLTLANVLGVPLGTALGQAAGWRSTF